MSFVPNSFGVGYPTDEYDDHGYQLFITGTTFVIAAGLFVTLRLWARYRKGNVGSDDVFVLGSLCFSIVLTVCMNFAVENGYGVSKSKLTKPQIREALKWFFFAQIFYKIVVMLTKVSLLLLYLRIFVSKQFHIATYVVLAIVGCWSIGSIIATICQCIPVQASWDARITDKTCINSDAAWYQYGITNILTDLIILALPIKPILDLELGRREKLGLLGVFSLGFLVCVISVLRVVVVANSTQLKTDQTGNFVPRSTLTLVEANFGIICACLPLTRQLLRLLFSRKTKGKSQSYELPNTGSSHPPFVYPVTSETQLGAHDTEADEQRPDSAPSRGSLLCEQNTKEYSP